jgi:serine/threonine-protein kinase
MDTDRNLLFGVLALQADLIDAARFAEACTAWSAHKGVPLADLLVERAWITATDKADIERLLQRKLARHGDDPRASLAAVADDEVQRVLAMLNDPAIEESLAGLSGQGGQGLVTTVDLPLQTLDRYRLTRLHAQGGIGQIWLARDGSLGRDVALKELRPEQVGKPALCARFLEEAKITGQLEHPGIVPVYELARRSRDDRPFYTMRFVKGRTLGEAVKTYHQERTAGTTGPLAQRALLNAFVGVCQAVAYAHSRGVVHRDLKGANVVLGDFGEVIVLDWGLAKLLGRPDGDAPPVALDAETEHEATLQGQVLGTPAYMAPEQAEGRQDLIDARTDVYGLGGILYEILTGRPVFTGSDTREVLRKVCTEPPVPPRQLVADVPLALEAVCLKALTKRREERYAAAADLAADVQRFLADEPVSALRESVTVRAGRWARRHRTWVAGAAAAACVAVLTLSVATVLLQRAKGVAELREQEASEQRQLAQEQRDEARAKYQLARDAVDQMLTQVGTRLLEDIPAMEPVRRALLEKALAFYQQFLKEKRDDPQLRQETARAYDRVGLIDRLLGRHGEAETAFQQAQNQLEQLIKEFPENPEYRGELAEVCTSLGVLAAVGGRTAAGEPALRRARDLIEPLVHAYPDRPAYQRELATCLHGLGRLYYETNRLPEAKAALEGALDGWERLTRMNPARADDRDELAWTYHSLGPLYRDTRQFDLAEAAFRRCISLWEQLLAEQPSSPSCQRGLASSHQHLGYLYQRYLGRLSQAEAPYQEALKGRERLAREHPLVVEDQLALAQSHGTLAWLYQTRRQTARAEAAFLSVLAVHEKLQHEHPTVPRYRFLVADSHHYLGGFYADTGQPAKAEAHYLKAVELCKQLVKEQPKATAYRVQLASIDHNLGMFYQLRQPAKAEAPYEEALALREELCRDHRNMSAYQRDLAWTYNGLGDVYHATARPEKAVAAYEKSLGLWQELVKVHPQVVVYAVGLGTAYGRQASRLSDAGKTQEALDWFERGIQILEKAHRQEPQHAEVRQHLLDEYHNRAALRTRLGQHAEALQDWDRALTLAGERARASLQVSRANSLARLGDHTRASAEAAALTQDKAATLGYNLACLWSLCSAAVRQDEKLPEAERTRLAEEYAVRALEQLKRSREAGHIKGAVLVAQLKNDPDLSALRQRDDFKKLLAELEAPPVPAGKK